MMQKAGTHIGGSNRNIVENSPGFENGNGVQARGIRNVKVSCSVCLENKSPSVCLPCKHLYCRSCLIKQLEVQHTNFNNCPECRAIIPLNIRDCLRPPHGNENNLSSSEELMLSDIGGRGAGAVKVNAKLCDVNASKLINGRGQDIPRTPLLEAVSRCQLKDVRTLLRQGADVKSLDAQCKGLLCVFCCELGYGRKTGQWGIDRGEAAELLQVLVNKGCALNGTGLGAEPVMFAVSNAAFPEAQLLIEMGADPFVVNKEGDTLLHNALRAARGPGYHRDELKGLVKTLLQAGVDVNQQNDFGVTPLHNGGFCTPDIVQKLIRHGACVGAQDHRGVTPLHSICRDRGDHAIGVAQCLLKNGASLDRVNEKGLTPLAYGLFYGGIELALVMPLVNAYRKLGGSAFWYMLNEQLFADGWSLLGLACRRGDKVPVVQYLLEQGAVTGRMTEHGTELAVAIENKNMDVAMFLIEKLKETPEAVNDPITPDGQTPLMLAAAAGETGVLYELLDCKNIAIDQTDNSGKTARDHASYHRHMQAEKLLILNAGIKDRSTWSR